MISGYKPQPIIPNLEESWSSSLSSSSSLVGRPISLVKCKCEVNFLLIFFDKIYWQGGGWGYLPIPLGTIPLKIGQKQCFWVDLPECFRKGGYPQFCHLFGKVLSVKTPLSDGFHNWGFWSRPLRVNFVNHFSGFFVNIIWYFLNIIQYFLNLFRQGLNIVLATELATRQSRIHPFICLFLCQ